MKPRICGNQFLNDITRNIDMKSNPFDVTKAVDYSDNDIYRYWVDMDGQDFVTVMKPSSLMPMMIVGSKGSGKTHIMKYYSYELQKIKCSSKGLNLKEELEKEKCLGVYIRCSGFNADQFSGKGVSDEMWSVLYGYFWELWIGERVVSMLIDMVQSEGVLEIDECSFVKKVYSLFLKPIHAECTLLALRSFLLEQQSELEYQVQSFMFMDQSHPNVDVLLPVNRLTYGIPNILKETVPFFKDKYIMYLIDELENFSERQQQLIQTLLREKPLSCNFRIGSRPYGIRTLCTLKNVEENHEGSEFEKIVLDDILREYPKYKEYVTKICENRLINSELDIPADTKIEELIETESSEDVLSKVFGKKERHSRAYMARLESDLRSLKKLPGSMVPDIMKLISFEKDYVIERANVVLLYRKLNKKRLTLLNDATDIHKSALIYYKDKNKESLHASFLGKYRQDVIDMLIREGRESISYSGLSKLIDLSCGTPRTILRLLKSAFNNQYFNTGEVPFECGRKLSVESQVSGIESTSDWFFEENRIPSFVKSHVIDSVTRLGNYLRTLRFSDAPPECSINIFSIPEEEMSEVARRNFDQLKKYSYFIEYNDRRKKNSEDKRSIYGLNSILIPKWELSLSHRGLVTFTKEEADLLFDVDRKEECDEYFSNKKKDYNFPFANQLSDEPSLFDLLEEF